MSNDTTNGRQTADAADDIDAPTAKREAAKEAAKQRLDTVSGEVEELVGGESAESQGVLVGAQALSSAQQHLAEINEQAERIARMRQTAQLECEILRGVVNRRTFAQSAAADLDTGADGADDDASNERED